MESKTVIAPCGVYHGIAREHDDVFYGIRYARAERFALPVVVSGEGECDASKRGECCPQYRAYYDEKKKYPFYHREFREGIAFTYGEDCLRLNIFAPKGAERRPVMIFLHGGSFIKGSGDERPFDGERYAEKGVITVTVNYRLGAFGFLSDGTAPYNLALCDQLAAIEWVHANISAFGGDPGNVTLAGQSAGAMSVQILSLNPVIRRMVRRVIMLSGGGATGGVLAPKSSRITRIFTRRVMRRAGVSDMDGLRAIGAKELFDAWNKECASPLSFFANMPVYDGNIADKTRYKDISRNVLPALIGVLKDDMAPPILMRTAKSYAKKSGVDVHIYKFVRDLPGDDRGAWHSADLWYFFGTLDRCWRPFTAADRELSERMIDAVCGFLQDGSFAPDWQPAPKCVKIFDIR